MCAVALVFASVTCAARETVYVPDDESLIDDAMFTPVHPTVICGFRSQHMATLYLCAVRKCPQQFLRVVKIMTCSWYYPARPDLPTACDEAHAGFQAKLCVFLAGSAVLLCMLIALSWRAYGALSGMRFLRRSSSCGSTGKTISQLTSVSRGTARPFHACGTATAYCLRVHSVPQS
jgi:hypothetical protein